jgi:hypothetical protein
MIGRSYAQESRWRVLIRVSLCDFGTPRFTPVEVPTSASHLLARVAGIGASYPLSPSLAPELRSAQRRRRPQRRRTAAPGRVLADGGRASWYEMAPNAPGSFPGSSAWKPRRPSGKGMMNQVSGIIALSSALEAPAIDSGSLRLRAAGGFVRRSVRLMHHDWSPVRCVRCRIR